VNIIALPGTPPNERLAALGVARVSYGPVPYRQMMAVLGEAAKAALG
jgi:2-methylisocitrate lyase-like PEP mutase family enzyme